MGVAAYGSVPGPRGTPHLFRAHHRMRARLQVLLSFQLARHAGASHVGHRAEEAALPIRNYSTVSRRQGVLPIRPTLTSPSSPWHVVIDATGLRVYGAGEWHTWKHGVRRRRTWRKLHLGIDESTKAIGVVQLTESRIHDSQRLPSFLEQMPDPIEQVSGDVAYDTRVCYEAVLQRGAIPTFVSRRTTRGYGTTDPAGWRAVRNHVLQEIKTQGRSVWRVLSGCTRQSVAENAMFRFTIRSAAVGTEPRPSTYRSAGEMRGAQSHDPVGDARNSARGMSRALPRVNCS